MTPNTKDNFLLPEQRAHAQAVRLMFSGIARRYDLLNHLLSGNTDKRWRKLVVRRLADKLANENARILDVACGTGDLALGLAGGGQAHVTGVDFCRPMLTIAKEKTLEETTRSLRRAIPYIEGDALSLPFGDNAFDAVTIAFGLRNLASVEGGIAELRRILKPSGRLIILEFSQPVLPGFRQLFNFYFTRVLPRIGGIVSGAPSAYEYLPRSVSKFPDQRRLAAMMRDEGFQAVTYQNLTGGIAAIHTGEKSE